MQGHAGAEQLRRLLDAVVSLGADLDLAVVLRRIIATAVDLVGASYGAIGVLDPQRQSLEDFITVGVDELTTARIGELPKGHGILGLLINDPKPLRLTDLTTHPDSFGFPPNHPPMTSFLGVPVFVRGEVFGNLYLTDKRDRNAFTEVDEELLVGLAAAAGVAIDNTRLHRRIRELDVVEERERIARDLHDTVIQRLFVTGLALQGAAELADRPEVIDRIQCAVDDLDATVREVRTSIFELQTDTRSATSLRRDLLAVGDEMAEALGFSPTFRFDGPIDAVASGERATNVVAVVRECLANVARHAHAPTAEVLVRVDDGRLTVQVEDPGRGIECTRPGGHGLANLESRAVAQGGGMVVEPVDPSGTRLRWWVPIR